MFYESTALNLQVSPGQKRSIEVLYTNTLTWLSFTEDGIASLSFAVSKRENK